MELKDYLSLIRRWAWLLVAGLFLGAAAGFLGSAFQTPIYQASTRVLVLRAPQEKTSDYTYLSDQQLVQTYIQLVTTRRVLDSTSAKLGYVVNNEQLTVQQIRDTQAIQLLVEDQNPQSAADIANTLVQVLVEQNVLIQSERYASTEQSIEAQIAQIQAQIAQMQNEIQNMSAETVQQQQQQVQAQITVLQTEATQLQNEIAQLTPPTTAEQQALLSERQARLEQIQPVLTLYQQVYTDLVVLGKPVSSGDEATHLGQLQTTLQLYQQIYINLLDNLETIRLARLQNTPNVVQIESAIVPDLPVRPRPVMNTILGAVIALLISGGIAFFIEYLDDTIRSPEDIELVLKLPVLGYIGDMSQTDGVALNANDIHVIKYPRSPISEAFRSLRTNLEFSDVDQTLSKILITSAGAGEGKTTVACNLASIIAQRGKRVLLIDADMRRPRIHSIFGVTNQIGLSTLFRENMTLRSVMRAVEGLENLHVITSGSPPPNPTELLASAKMDQILADAVRVADIVIVDSPPSLVADFQVLSTKMDGVVLVVKPGQTQADAAFSMVNQLKRVNARSLGVVLNKIPRGDSYYGNYHYYAYKRGYYETEAEKQAPLPAPNAPALGMLPENESGVSLRLRDAVPAQYEQDSSENMEIFVFPQDVPATTNVSTKPRRSMDAMQKLNTSKENIHVWYAGMDDEDR